MRSLILLFVLLVAGCDNPFGPDLPAGAIETQPHPVFPEYWLTVESDTGLRGDYGSIRWYQVQGGAWLMSDGSTARGMWVKSGNRIFIADIHWTDSSVVLHEMLHAILRDPSHNHPLFQTQKYNFVRLR